MFGHPKTFGLSSSQLIDVTFTFIPFIIELEGDSWDTFFLGELKNVDPKQLKEKDIKEIMKKKRDFIEHLKLEKTVESSRLTLKLYDWQDKFDGDEEASPRIAGEVLFELDKKTITKQKEWFVTKLESILNDLEVEFKKNDFVIKTVKYETGMLESFLEGNPNIGEM